jgi:hypothetical protein
MKQSENHDEFFKKYGFTKSSSQPHPVYKDTMTFEGLEADYVFRLEQERDHYKELFVESRRTTEWWMHREFYRLAEKK